MAANSAHNEVVNKINAQFRRGSWQRETTVCLCGSCLDEEIATTDWFGLDCRMVICRECGLLRLNPRPTDAAYKHLYESDEYRLIHSGDNFLKDAETRFHSETGLVIRDTVEREVGSVVGKNVVEIGAGAGWNLKRFEEAGAHVSGFDYSRALVSLGRNLGLAMFQGSFTEAKAAGVKADVLILNHVIEHLLDIPKALDDVRSLLAPGGLIYIGLPNIDNFNKGQCQLAHTYYFSPRTFRHYMNAFGLELVILEPALEIHMHALARFTDQSDGLIQLNGEYGRMKAIIRGAELRGAALSLLSILRVKDSIKSLRARVFPYLSGKKSLRT